MNAITLLKADHKTVEELFKKFEAAGDKNPKAKRKVVEQIIKELSIHAAIEEQLFYPAVREALDDAEDDVLESLEEHHVVKWLLSELEGMDPDMERFDAKVTVLIENVRHHVQDEEKELFPRVRDGLPRRRLEELGDLLEAAKRTAPTRPHPRAPDTPPGNLAIGAGAALMDRARDAGRGLMARATTRRGEPGSRAAAPPARRPPASGSRPANSRP